MNKDDRKNTWIDCELFVDGEYHDKASCRIIEEKSFAERSRTCPRVTIGTVEEVNYEIVMQNPWPSAAGSFGIKFSDEADPIPIQLFSVSEERKKAEFTMKKRI